MKLRTKVIILSCACVALVSTAFCGWQVSQSLDNLKVEIAEMDKTGADLQNELKSLDKTSSEITEQIVELAFKNSNEVGNEVANLQNAYIDFRINGVTERFSSKENLVSISLRILLLSVHCRGMRVLSQVMQLSLYGLMLRLMVLPQILLG